MFLGRSPSREDEEHLLPNRTASLLQQSVWDRLPRWRLTSALGVLLSCLAFMRPSFLRPSADAALSEKSASYSKTAYLDGIRGLAAFFVFILHWAKPMYPTGYGWGYQDHRSFLELPFVRIIYSGSAMVSVFFVLSGFVLTHRFIRRMHSQEYPELYAGLTSITFRRVLRLFLPAMASGFLTYIGADLGIVKVPRLVQGKPFQHGPAAFLQYLDMEANPFEWEIDAKEGWYNPHIWTIAVELRGSLVVFLLVLGLAKCRTSIRLLVETLLVAYSFAHERWDIALFIAGMLVAELEIAVRMPTGLWQRRLANALLVTMLLFGLLLCGYPKDAPTETPGYMWTGSVWPHNGYRWRFWMAIGGIFFVGATAFLPLVQQVFLWAPIRYLGKVSFSLYLVHGFAIRTLGRLLQRLTWYYIGNEGYWPYNMSFAVATAILFPITIWWADMFTRGIDAPSIDLARWLEKKCASKKRALPPGDQRSLSR